MNTTRETDLPIDTALEILTDRHRRLVIRFLTDTTDGVASYAELAEYIAARSSPDKEKVRTQLHHVTLPKLESANLVEYDSRGETVRYRPKPLVESVLDTVETYEA